MFLKYKVSVLVLVLIVGFSDEQLLQSRFSRFPMKAALMLKKRFQNRIDRYNQRNTQIICYDKVGCFNLPHKRSPLQKVPENPETLETKFYLFRKDVNFSKPEVIYPDDDGKSLKESSFKPKEILKMYIHGYMSKWNERGAIVAADAFLKLYDCNYIVMDWAVGARGPQYATAAANTEVVGRQLGILLLNMIQEGLNPKNIHLIGFSLGAHVAGTASEVLKSKGHLIGRITGLDAASPLFRSNYFREKHKKLDRSDAEFVDVLHTDASPSVTDGFGLWEPIGHVDYFPNGGQEQPGCTDTKSSIVVTTFEKSLTREIACSHIRAYHLYLETLLNKIHNKKCQFIAYSCPGGLPSYERGHCFAQLDKANSSLALDPSYRSEIGMFGEDSKGEGVMYFTTTDKSPFCGTQLQAAIHISQKTTQSRGIILLSLQYGSYKVNFQVHSEIRDFVMTGSSMNAISVAPYNSLSETTETINATLTYFDAEPEHEGVESNFTTNPTIYIDRIIVRDMYGNSWQFCERDTIIRDKLNPNKNKKLTLTKNLC